MTPILPGRSNVNGYEMYCVDIIFPLFSWHSNSVPCNYLGFRGVRVCKEPILRGSTGIRFSFCLREPLTACHHLKHLRSNMVPVSLHIRRIGIPIDCNQGFCSLEIQGGPPRHHLCIVNLSNMNVNLDDTIWQLTSIAFQIMLKVLPNTFLKFIRSGYKE